MDFPLFAVAVKLFACPSFTRFSVDITMENALQYKSCRKFQLVRIHNICVACFTRGHVDGRRP